MNSLVCILIRQGKTEVNFKKGRLALRVQGDLPMESGMEEETSEVLSTLALSEQSGHAAAPPGAPEQDEDSFFDCQETLGEESASRGGARAAEKETGGGEEEGEREGERADTDTERREGPEDGEEEEEGVSDGDGGEDWEDLGEEWREKGEQEAGGVEGEKEQAEEGKDDCDSELKEEAPVEFDEEYLQELEKDLSEEEKESRREESLRLKETGNGQFKKGEHVEAEGSYTAALGVCPVCYSKERSILFSNRAAARLHLDQKEKAIADCTKAIELNPNYVRAVLRRAELYEKTDKLDEALEDYKAVLEKDSTIPQAREACMLGPVRSGSMAAPFSPSAVETQHRVLRKAVRGQVS
ncbi:hypothetical protein SKAU_G00424620 [Synaphobranchus kaupii]|uniref:Tetratricopeptide repeat protein 1 n=1 Tax=Synaphobranchus kaupii TaxID=118154 RepID=A0A9Q1E5K1_SYNKA|nr:hypothetical protein SKAU_G00424620 [Synaphobranchus kaupii]